MNDYVQEWLCTESHKFVWYLGMALVADHRLFALLRDLGNCCHHVAEEDLCKFCFQLDCQVRWGHCRLYYIQTIANRTNLHELKNVAIFILLGTYY